MVGRGSFAIVVLFVVMVVGITIGRFQDQHGPAPAFSLREAYGGQVDLASYRGRTVLLVFWAPWCGVCRGELPILQSMSTELRNSGVEVVTIHLGELESARQFLRETHMSLTTLVDPDQTVGNAYGVRGIPNLVLVGPDGKIAARAVGGLDEDTLRQWIAGARKS
jgi:peroxiredoxin